MNFSDTNIMEWKSNKHLNEYKNIKTAQLFFENVPD